ncbi:MAG: hypothetical protein C6W58_07035 [Bacillaceae bacterium]|nr:MAG: hypothetical protein C6W58_07035 [Bacillaceae bacterium]
MLVIVLLFLVLILCILVLCILILLLLLLFILLRCFIQIFHFCIFVRKKFFIFFIGYSNFIILS